MPNPELPSADSINPEELQAALDMQRAAEADRAATRDKQVEEMITEGQNVDPFTARRQVNAMLGDLAIGNPLLSSRNHEQFDVAQTDDTVGRHQSNAA